MIDLTNTHNLIEDIVGEIDGIKLFLNYNFWTKSIKVYDFLNKQFIKSLILTLPSEVIIRVIFNDKIKIGNLILDFSPQIILTPFYVIKTLKEWDLLLHSEKIYEDEIVIVNVKDICETTEYVYPMYDYIARVFEQHYLGNCGTDGLEKLKENSIRTKLREGVDMIRSGKPGVLYKSEAQYLNLEYKNIKGSKIDFYIGLMKNSSKNAINAYEILRNNKLTVL
ncbi:MAG: hypothetical protein QXR34_09650 [Saccharolobus sp.]